MQIHSFGKIISRRQNALPEQRSGSSALSYKIIIADGRRHWARGDFSPGSAQDGDWAPPREERALNVGAVSAPPLHLQIPCRGGPASPPSADRPCILTIMILRSQPTMKISRGGAAGPGRCWLVGTEARPTRFFAYKPAMAFEPQPGNKKALAGTEPAELKVAFYAP